MIENKTVKSGLIELPTITGCSLDNNFLSDLMESIQGFKENIYISTRDNTLSVVVEEERADLRMELTHLPSISLSYGTLRIAAISLIDKKLEDELGVTNLEVIDFRGFERSARRLSPQDKDLFLNQLKTGIVNLSFKRPSL